MACETGYQLLLIFVFDDNMHYTIDIHGLTVSLHGESRIQSKQLHHNLVLFYVGELLSSLYVTADPATLTRRNEDVCAKPRA
jgi:hypothetical protein